MSKNYRDNPTVTLATVKVGDAVRLVRNVAMRAKVGAKATVTSIKPPYVYVEWDRSNSDSEGQMDGGYAPESFVFDTNDDIYIIVRRHQNGKLAPAETPRVLTSASQALRVAHEMAAKHGCEFLVFKATDSVKARVVTNTVTERTRL